MIIFILLVCTTNSIRVFSFGFVDSLFVGYPFHSVSLHPTGSQKCPSIQATRSSMPTSNRLGPPGTMNNKESASLWSILCNCVRHLTQKS
ncbi:unnamed protein product [Amoebophrya sp. A120]|nr:unnamed protein product [Amoebophrya sp. A120]